MTKILTDILDEDTKKNSELFLKHIESEMMHKTTLLGDSLSFDWVDILEESCIYIDNIVRNPKLMLIREENIVKIEKARKVTVDTVKDLAKHTYFIDKVDPITGDVQPAKLLDIRGIDTFNTYENRFIYTLLDKITRFVEKKRKELENFQSKNEKLLEYAAKTNNKGANVRIELKINSFESPEEGNSDKFKKQIDEIQPRIIKISEYISIWNKSEFSVVLQKERASFIMPPVKKTNIILKNPNFQVAMKLWNYLKEQEENQKSDPNNPIEKVGEDILKQILDQTFLINYLVLDSVSDTKKELKENLLKCAAVMLEQEIKNVITLLFKLGVNITDEELLSLIANEIKNERDKNMIGTKDVKEKFKSEIEEYLERTKDYL
ncbi:MAG: DUF2357 domain-containing protein [Bacilli bacterium]